MMFEFLKLYFFIIQYDAVGWAPKEYNPDDKQSVGGQEQAGGQISAQKDDSAAQSAFVWDEASGYYYDAASGFYFDGNTGSFYISCLTCTQWKWKITFCMLCGFELLLYNECHNLIYTSFTRWQVSDCCLYAKKIFLNGHCVFIFLV